MSPEPTSLADLGSPAAFAHARTLLADATDALLDDVRAMDDDAVRAPSLLPGWTRGHVLCHVARNADAMVNLVTSARTGRAVPMYPDAASRDADIEAGAHRSAAEQEADVESSAERFLAALVDLPADRLTAVVEGRAGVTLPAHDIVWGRLREVAYHHVDLAVGTTFADLPPEVVERGLTEGAGRTVSADGPAMTWVVTDSTTGPRRLDVGAGGPAVEGTAADLLGWASGRTDGSRLTSDAPLPALPSWG